MQNHSQWIEAAGTISGISTAQTRYFRNKYMTVTNQLLRQEVDRHRRYLLALRSFADQENCSAERTIAANEPSAVWSNFIAKAERI